MNSFLRGSRARLAIAVIPMTEQVHAHAAQGVDYDIGFPQAYIRTSAREHGIPYLDLLPILREHLIRTNERLYWRLDPHLNNRGHEIVGNALAERFRCCIRNVRRRRGSAATEAARRRWVSALAVLRFPDALPRGRRLLPEKGSHDSW